MLTKAQNYVTNNYDGDDMQSPRLYANGVYAAYAARPCDHSDEEDPQPGAPPVVPQQ